MNFDPVEKPQHYADSKIECIDAIKEATKHLTGFEGYCVGNIIKYAWRYKKKNGIEDVKKAGAYIQFLTEYLIEK